MSMPLLAHAAIGNANANKASNSTRLITTLLNPLMPSSYRLSRGIETIPKKHTETTELLK